jgi:hypothetical protein
MKNSLSFITLGVVSTPMAGKPGIIDAQVVDYGPKGGKITIGDRVEGFIAIKNTGRVPIEKVTMHINLEKDLPVTGMTSLFKGDFQERMNIEPGDTKTYKRAGVIPEQFMEVPLLGSYRINLSLLIEGFEFCKIEELVQVDRKETKTA